MHYALQMNGAGLSIACNSYIIIYARCRKNFHNGMGKSVGIFRKQELLKVR